MAAFCAYYHMRPVDYYDLTLAEFKAMVTHINDEAKARERAAKKRR